MARILRLIWRQCVALVDGSLRPRFLLASSDYCSSPVRVYISAFSLYWNDGTFPL